jgi:hypothetical protein
MNLTTEALIRVLAVNNYMIPTATNDPLLDANVNVFPNPVKNVLTIENKSVLTLEDVYIYNTLGEVVLQEELSVNVGDDATINLQGLTNGIYFVKMKADNSWLSRKITVVK